MSVAITIETENGSWAIRLAGEGSEGTVIALHGFAMDWSFYSGLIDALGATHRLVLADLPFHGTTSWKQESYRPSDLLELFENLMTSGYVQGPVTLMGHSLGARLLLAVLPDLPFPVNRVLMLTPDGIASRGQFFSDSIPPFVRKFSKNWLLKGSTLLALTDLLHRLYLLPDFYHRYMQKQLSGVDKRGRLYHTWLSSAYFRPRPVLIRRWIQQNEAGKLVWVLAQLDRIVPFERAYRQLEKKKLDTGSRVMVFQDGHELRSIAWEHLFE